MKKILVVFGLLFSLLLITEPFAMTVSSIYNSCNTIQTTTDCCETETKSHCETENSDQTNSCTNDENCAMVCCVSIFYFLQNKNIDKTSLSYTTEKKLIFSKPDLFTKGYKSDWFHPPNAV